MRWRNRPQKIMGLVLVILGLAFTLAPRFGIDAPELLPFLGWALIAVGIVVWSVRLASLKP
jgi:uncharacterized protein YjeT (DUF2065 family)